MNKLPIIFILIVGIILISGCAQQQTTELRPNQTPQVTRPALSTEDFISEINELKNSMTEIKEGLRK